MALVQNVLGKSMGLPSIEKAGNALPMPKFNEPIQPPGERFQAVPGGLDYNEPKNLGEIAPTPQTRYANLGKIPGQFFQAPGAKTGIIREEREGAVSQKQKEQYRVGVSGKLVEIDHIMPQWLGGSSTPENLRALGKGRHETITKGQAAILELYRNPETSKKLIGRELDLPEARMWAIRAIDFTPAQVKGLNIGEGGFLTNKNAADAAANAFNSWNATPSKLGWSAVRDYLQGGDTTGWQALKSILPIPTSWKEAGIAVRAGLGAPFSTKESKMAGETIGRGVAQAMPDTVESRFLQGVTTAATLGHVPIPTKPTDTAALKAAHFGGGLFGGLAPLFASGIAIQRGAAAFNKIAPNLAAKMFPGAAAELAGAAKTEAASVDYVKNKFINLRWKSFLKRLPGNAAVFGTLGQLSRQEQNTLDERAKHLLADMGLAGVVSVAKPGFTKELGGVIMGTVAIDSLAGASPAEAWTNGIVMGLFHGFGGIGHDAPFYKSSVEAANKFTQARILPGETLYRPEKLPTTQADIESVKSGYETELLKLRSRIESDPNLTPEQQRSEILNVTLSQNVKYLSTLPVEERNRLSKENQKSLLAFMEKNPEKIKTTSREADDAAEVATSYRRERGKWTEFAAEDGTEFNTGGVVGELPRAAVDRIERARQDGVLVSTEDGRLVPDADVKTMSVLRDDIPTADGGPALETILVPPDGKTVSLGLGGPEVKPIIDRMIADDTRMMEVIVPQIVLGEHPKVTVKVTDTLHERSKTIGEIDRRLHPSEREKTLEKVKKGLRNKENVAPAKPPAPLPKDIPSRVVQSEGTFEFAQPKKEVPIRTREDVESAQSKYPAISIKAILKERTATGTIPRDMIPALNDGELQQALRESTIAGRKRGSEEGAEFAIDKQIRGLFKELERRLEKKLIEDPGLDSDIESQAFRDASIAIEKELEKTQEQLQEIALTTPYQKTGVIDPRIIEETTRLQKEKGYTPEVAQEEAIRQDITMRKLGLKPKAKLAYKTREKLAEPAATDVMAKIKEKINAPAAKPVASSLVKFGERVTIGTRETYAAPGADKMPLTEAEGQMQRARQDIESIVSSAGVPKHANDIKDHIAGLHKSVQEYIKKLPAYSGKKHRLTYASEETTHQTSTPKMTPTELPGYKGMTKKDINAGLRDHAEGVIDQHLENILRSKETEYQGNEGPGYQAKQRFQQGLDKGEWTEEQNVASALWQFYSHNNLEPIQRNPVLKYLAEFNPEAQIMEDVWSRQGIADGKDLEVKKDFARLWIDGRADVPNKQLLEIPEVRDRLMSFEKPDPDAPKVLDISKLYNKKLETVSYKINGTTRAVTNPIARSFAETAKSLNAKGEKDLADFWDSFNQKTFDKYQKIKRSDAPNWFETMLDRPGELMAADSSLNSEIRMTPVEAEAVKHAFNGTLDKATHPIVREIAVAVKAADAKDISLVPNDIHSQRANIRSIAKMVVGKHTELGKHLMGKATTADEIGAVEDFLGSNENTSYLHIPEGNGKSNSKLFEAYIDYHRALAENITSDIDAYQVQRYGSELSAKFGAEPESFGELLDRLGGKKTLDIDQERRLRDMRESETRHDAPSEGELQEGYSLEIMTDPQELRPQNYSILELVTTGLSKKDGQLRKDFETLSDEEKSGSISKRTGYLANLVAPSIKERRNLEWYIEKKKSGESETTKGEAAKIRSQIIDLNRRQRGFLRSGDRENLQKKVGELRKELRTKEGGPAYGEPFKKYDTLKEALRKQPEAAKTGKLKKPGPASAETIKKLKEKFGKDFKPY